MDGADRAGYGDGLLDALSRALRSRQVSNTDRRQLYGYLRFYPSYPQIVRTASAPFLAGVHLAPVDTPDSPTKLHWQHRHPPSIALGAHRVANL